MATSRTHVLAAILWLTMSSGGAAQGSRSTAQSVITTQQRIAPAGIQTVFDGRVRGVAFNAAGDEVWALTAAPFGGTSAVARLAWRTNRFLGTARLPGANAQGGLQGVRLDPVTGAAVVSYIGTSPPPETGPTLILNARDI